MPEYEDTYIDPLAQEVNDQYEAAFMSKEHEGLHDEWQKFEEYWLGHQHRNKPSDSPKSNTNIVRQNIESMVADLVMEPLEILLKGWNRSDRAHAPRSKLALEWVWEKNKMNPKRDKFNRTRLKLGTAVWKVYFDGKGKGVVGMPMVMPLNPSNFFVDPKIKDKDDLHMADYIIHATAKPKKYLRKIYGTVVDETESNATPPRDPDMFDQGDVFDSIAGDKVLVLERWTLEDDYRLRKVVVGDDIVLYDSDEDEDEEKVERGYYPIKRYPFVIVPCWPREGSIWGVGLADTLISVQDIIDDLDDQIRINARLTGNIQKVISVSSGINPNMWTNEPGLNIPARNVDGFRVVEPPNMPSYILNRRAEARDIEAPNLAARHDVVEGRRPGSLRAASAIMALQEQGMKQAVHLRNMDQEGLEDVFAIILDYITEYWTEEQEIGEDLTTFRGTDLQDIDILKEGEEGDLPLLDPETGTPMTRRANFDITVNIGGGFLNNKAFIFQAIIELTQYQILTQEEARILLKQILSFPIIDPYNPIGEFMSQAGPQMQQMMPQGGAAMAPLDIPQEMGMGSGIPPEMMEQMVAALGGGMSR